MLKISIPITHGHFNELYLKMKIFTFILSVIALLLIVFNATKLNFETLFKGESYIAILTIIASFCVIILLQIFRISKKIERLDKQRK